MPATGARSEQRCQHCGEEMYWSPDAIVTDSFRGTSQGLRENRQSEAGYRCENEHVSDACAICRSRDTIRFGAGPAPGQCIVTCRACGNTSTIEAE
jgi:hypothetical protein